MKHLIPYLIIIILSLLCAILGFVIHTKDNSINRLENNVDLLLANNEELKLEITNYKLHDSLNIAQIKSLELTVKEFRRSQLKDKKLIKDLKIRAKDLEAVINTRMEKRDTILIKAYDTKKDTIAFNYASLWTDLSGFLDVSTKSMQVNIANREELKVIENVKRKRFLGFLWYCKKLESRKIDVISLNPNTTITNISYIHIEQ